PPRLAWLVASLSSSDFSERTRSPRFLDDPCIRALVLHPGGAPRPRPRSFDLCVGRDAAACHGSHRVGPTKSAFRGCYPTARMPAVYASQPPSRADHARLASGWWPPPLAGRDPHPRVATIGLVSLHHFLQSQTWPGARLPTVDSSRVTPRPWPARNG